MNDKLFTAQRAISLIMYKQFGLQAPNLQGRVGSPAMAQKALYFCYLGVLI
ncbi:MAG: hypothetical protein ACJAVX_002335 [Pseudoalteromonas rhizosphaerae]|jgi:hypothetical protein|tara:strand:+ start:77 stop:229 length:153 start_codon:yes stop_codon:yes gene_type:complete